MVIAVNTRIVSGNENAARVLIEMFTELAAANRKHIFYFISSKELETASSPDNVKYHVIKQQSSKPLLWKLWYNYRLPALLRKIKADILISADAVCSLRTALPQYIIVNDLSFLQEAEGNNKKYAAFQRANLRRFLQKATGVITFSSVVKSELASEFNVPEEKMLISSYMDKNYQPVKEEQKEKIKEQYTGGKEYFLYTGAIHTGAFLTNLLKAFSLFKKRQKSAMQLVLLVNTIPEKNEFAESLRLYKYRSDVQLLEQKSSEETMALTAAAWCAVNLSSLLTDIVTLQNALRCGVPVIAGNAAQAGELLQNGALYTNPAAIDAVAEQLMLVYKDETKRKELAANGQALQRQQQYEDAVQNLMSFTGIQ